MGRTKRRGAARQNLPATDPTHGWWTVFDERDRKITLQAAKETIASILLAVSAMLYLITILGV